MSLVNRVLDYPLFRLGQTDVTALGLTAFVLLTILLIFLSGRLQRWLADRALPRDSMHVGVRQSIAAIVRYVTIAIGLLIILETLGVDLTTLTVIAGAVGIGVGFGLQSIAANILSGFIILIERPVKIGDRIEVDGVAGTVTEIRARSTTVLTNDNIAILIPNSTILTENVINWSYTGDIMRFRVPVRVAYDSDVRRVERLLLAVAGENPDVLPTPAPAVRFTQFGDSALEFELLVWTTTQVHHKGALVSALNFALFDAFAAHGIHIPLPQREVHVRDGRASAAPPFSAST